MTPCVVSHHTCECLGLSSARCPCVLSMPLAPASKHHQSCWGYLRRQQANSSTKALQTCGPSRSHRHPDKITQTQSHTHSHTRQSHTDTISDTQSHSCTDTVTQTESHTHSRTDVLSSTSPTWQLCQSMLVSVNACMACAFKHTC